MLINVEQRIIEEQAMLIRYLVGLIDGGGTEKMQSAADNAVWETFEIIEGLRREC